MTLSEIYTRQPVLENELVRLRPIVAGDAAALLPCYSDPHAVPFFNADNCNGDDFHYTTLARMEQAITFWQESYQTRQFVRWTVEDQALGEVIGTVEMFHSGGEEFGGPWGILRIDLQSRYETRAFLYAVVALCLRHFYDDFEVERILLKAVPRATERRAALEAAGFTPLSAGPHGYPHYYERKR
ncbi:MAG: GNAT family N-acetyltransferase [Eubacteriales bacterium]|nr:GNAT family N-acetyltransferase [Eubacteriales bacterium]